MCPQFQKFIHFPPCVSLSILVFSKVHFKPNLFAFIYEFVCVHMCVPGVNSYIYVCVSVYLYTTYFNFKYMLFNKFEFSPLFFTWLIFPFYFTEELQHKLGNISLISFIPKTLENYCIPDVFNISHNFTHFPFLTLLFCLSTLLTWIFSYDLSLIFSLLCHFKAHLYSDIIQWSKVQLRVIFLTTLNL